MKDVTRYLTNRRINLLGTDNKNVLEIWRPLNSYISCPCYIEYGGPNSSRSGTKICCIKLTKAIFIA